MRRVVWSEPARNDLIRIERWLDDNWASPNTLRTLKAIRERCDFLPKFPQGGGLLTDELRKLRVLSTPYLLLYRVTPDTITVVRIVHEREDWQSLL